MKLLYIITLLFLLHIGVGCSEEKSSTPFYQVNSKSNRDEILGKLYREVNPDFCATFRVEACTKNLLSPILIDKGRLFFVQPNFSITVLDARNGSVIKSFQKKDSRAGNKMGLIPLNVREFEIFNNLIIGTSQFLARGFVMDRHALEVLNVGVAEDHLKLGKYLLFLNDDEGASFGVISNTLTLIDSVSLAKVVLTRDFRDRFNTFILDGETLYLANQMDDKRIDHIQKWNVSKGVYEWNKYENIDDDIQDWVKTIEENHDISISHTFKKNWLHPDTNRDIDYYALKNKKINIERSDVHLFVSPISSCDIPLGVAIPKNRDIQNDSPVVFSIDGDKSWKIKAPYFNDILTYGKYFPIPYELFSFACDDDHLYIFSKTGRVVCLRKEDGSFEWMHRFSVLNPELSSGQEEPDIYSVLTNLYRYCSDQ